MLLYAAMLAALKPVPVVQEPNLVGTWVARHRNGPDAHGVLRIQPGSPHWTAQISGQSVQFDPAGQDIRFELPGGSFRGHRAGGEIEGHWIQPQGLISGFLLASPVTLTKEGSEWSGMVTPLDDRLTMFLVVKRAEDGTLKAFYRNPERNLGMLLRLDHLEVKGNEVTAIGTWGGSKTLKPLGSGKYDPENNVISLYDPAGGFTDDFSTNDNEPFDEFHPRPAKESTYHYAKPADRSDGWKTATPEEVGLSRPALEKFIQAMIQLPDDSVNDVRIHGLLLARHGKLVLEEYFHGYSADRPHDTRSAAKSLTSVLAGIAMGKDPSFRLDTPVYKVMNGGQFPAGLDPQKRAITVENLLTMSSGLNAIDRLEDSPGREDAVQEQKKDLDWYHYTMELPMAFKPGEKAEYASMLPNLLGGAIAKQTKTWLPDFFRENFAKPLGITRYYMPIQPNGEAYMGGGMQWMPRDFLKLSQLMLDKGRWKGKQIISEQYAQRAVESLYDLSGIKYGYLWWTMEYPYKGRTVTAHFAGGNGGQVSMFIPGLDLAFVAFGGNYASAATFKSQREFVPQYVLPAVVGN